MPDLQPRLESLGDTQGYGAVLIPRDPDTSTLGIGNSYVVSNLEVGAGGQGCLTVGKRLDGSIAAEAHLHWLKCNPTKSKNPNMSNLEERTHVGQQIALGAFGAVGTPTFAVKHGDVSSEYTAHMTLEERACQGWCTHIVQLLDFHFKMGEPILFFELMQMDLLSFKSGLVSEGHELDEGACLHLASEITSGVAWLHGLRFVHSDIKLENIMLTFPDASGKQRAVIIDLGLAFEAHMPNLKDGQGPFGTYPYMSREFILATWDNPDNPAILAISNMPNDVWAIGVSIVELHTSNGVHPFVPNSEFPSVCELYHALCVEHYFEYSAQVAPYVAHQSLRIEKLLSQIFCEERLTADQLLEAIKAGYSKPKAETGESPGGSYSPFSPSVRSRVANGFRSAVTRVTSTLTPKRRPAADQAAFSPTSPSSDLR